MPQSESNRLIQAEKLIEACKLDEALEILNDLVQLEGNNIQQKVSYQLRKGQILLWQAKYEEAIRLGKEIFKENQKLNKKLHSVDGLILVARGLIVAEKFDNVLVIIEQAESILKSISQLSQNDLMQRKAHITVYRGWIYFQKREIELAQKCMKWTIDLQKELGVTPQIVLAHITMAMIMNVVNSEFNLALEYTKKAMSLAVEIKNQFWIALSHLEFGNIYGDIGEFDLSIEHSTKSLIIFKKINNKRWIATLLNNIGYNKGIIGEYDLALEYLEQSLNLYEQVNSMVIDSCLDSLIFVSLEKGDIVRARQYFQRLEILYNQKKDRNIRLIYLYNKALIFKLSSRIRDKAKAEELFKQVIEKEPFYFGITIQALIHLCDLLLMELRINSNVEVIDEINHYIAQLLIIAENSHSYLVLCETYILQSKLALLNLDMKAARRLLTKAQKIAESYGIRRLALKISTEHDELLSQLNMWENFKEPKASLNELLKFTRLNEQMDHMIRKRLINIPELSDEQPVLLLIVSEGGTPFFSQSFIKDQSFEDHLFAGFLSAINSFMDEMFSEGLDRAVFGEHTLLMNSVSPFFMCYIFKGQSYSAQHRIKSFIDKLQRDKDVWDTFKKFYQMNKEIQLKDVPSLEPLIKEIFIDRTIILTE